MQHRRDSPFWLPRRGARPHRPPRWALVVACVAATLTGLAACGGAPEPVATSLSKPTSATATNPDTTSGPIPATSATTATTTTERPCELDDGTGEELRARITDALPPPYEAAPDAAEDTGPFDLQQALDDVPTPGEEEVLRAHGFRRGFSRLWYHVGSDELDLRLYEFCEGDGPDAYAQHTRRRLTDPLWGFRELADTGLPADTIALLTGTAGTDGYVALLESHGPYLVIASARSAGGEQLDHLVARARLLLDAQVATLS